MAGMKEIVRTSQASFEKIANGTHDTETYSDETLYSVALGDSIEVGSDDSGMEINSSNQLVLSSDVVRRTTKTAMDSIAEVNTSYYLGEQTTVSIQLPTTSLTVGGDINIVFYSGATTATTLSVTGTYLGTLPVPSLNQRVELNFLWDGVNWYLISKSEDTV